MPNLSHRASLLLVMILGLAGLELWKGGSSDSKLSRAWAALNGSAPSTSSGGSSSTSSPSGGGGGGGHQDTAESATSTPNDVFMAAELGAGHPAVAYPV